MGGLFAPVSRWFQRRPEASESREAWSQTDDSGVGAEAPIRTASADRLRRGDFAARIAGVLSELNLREGRIFAIRGGWGFGKSSLKNLIVERLQARDDGADWLDFNPWQWGHADAIARALFGQIADRLGGEHSKKAMARAEALRRYGAILTNAGAPLKKASGSGPLITTLLTNVSVIAVAAAIGFDLPSAAKLAMGLAVLSLCLVLLGKLLTHLGRDRSGDSLDKVRAGLEKQLYELDRPLVIFVDDIDRLEPEQIRTLLRQVKANANLPNIVFVLLFQASIVERALDPVADNDGRAFLEKIVQVSFDLPAVPVGTVHQMFGEELSALAGTLATKANGFETTRYGNVFVDGIQPRLRNMRDARRLISSIAVHLPLHVADGVFEVNVVDFLLLETIRVFEPDLHAALFYKKDLLLKGEGYQGAARNDVQRAEIMRLIEIVSEPNKEMARRALRHLFPQIEWAMGGPHYADGFHKQWLAAKRVCSARHFAQYFELQSAVGEISESRLATILAETENAQALNDAIDQVETEGLLHSLVARFDESVDRLPTANAHIILPALFRVGQKLAGRDDNDPFSSPWVHAWRAASWYLEKLPREARGALALQALRETQALSVAFILIHLNDPADHQDDKSGAFDPKLDLETVQAMKAEWLIQIRQRARNAADLLAEPDLVSWLYRWKDFTDSFDEPRAWAASIIETDEGFAAIASRLTRRGSTFTQGDRVATVVHHVDRTAVEDFIGTNAAWIRLQTLDSSTFPIYAQALETLRRAVDPTAKRSPFE